MFQFPAKLPAKAPESWNHATQGYDRTGRPGPVPDPIDRTGLPDRTDGPT